MGLNSSRFRSNPHADVRVRESYQELRRDESEGLEPEAEGGSCSIFSRCCSALFSSTSRKRRRSEDGETSTQRQSKLIRLDVATEIEPTLQNDAETQTYVSTEGVSTQTSDTVEKDVISGTADTLVKPGKVDAPVIPGKADTLLDGWLDFPFLRDELSIKQLQVGKTMIIVRGLPGSGKSFLVKQIKLQYPQSVSCSADDFFMVDGKYDFQVKNLQKAHSYSQSTCEKYCREDKCLIIIDNTNVKRWEMAPYYSMAEKFRYLVVLVEPRTPWKFDVEQLVARNSHGVELNVLQKRRNEYETIIPRYFGLFLNRGDSVSLLQQSKELLLRALLCSKDFFQDFKQFSGCDNIEEMLNFYSRTNCMGLSKHILHLTTKFFRNTKGKKDKASQDLSYYDSYLGMSSRLCIAGFSITKRTLGAKIILDKHQLELWEQNDNEELPQPGPQKNGHKAQTVPAPVPPHNKQQPSSNSHDDLQSNLFSSLVTRSQKVSKKKLFQSKGRRAHLTLGTSGETKPVETGLDTIRCMQLLEKSDSQEVLKLPSGPGMVEGNLIKLDPSSWFIQLDRYMTVNAIFTGSY